MTIDMSEPARWTFPDLSERIGAVEADESDWRRLAEYAVRRRIELGFTQDQVKDGKRPSVATVRNIETAAQTSYQPGVIAAFERALRWQGGSVQRILANQEPVELGQPAPTDDMTPSELEQYEGRLTAIRDNPNRSPALRAWARNLLGQIGEIYAADEEETQRRAG